MLKQFTALIFCMAFALQTFHKAFIVLDYHANKTAYLERCENKARPKMHCNGKCQMKKKLQEEQKKEEKNPERKAESKNGIVLSSKSFFPSIPLLSIYEQHSYASVPAGREVKLVQPVFRPPVAV
ncbi:MAG TPA: hypothetical protein VL098_11130 [Flavipsychrobacter sp.]|nr:hypothetical protein [Flavipsychrobacter sp.]